MASGSQRDPNRHPVLCWVDIDLMARVFTAIEGRTVARVGCGRRGRESGEREMGVSDLFIEAVGEAVKGVKPSPKALAKCKQLLERGRKRNKAGAWASLTDEERRKASDKKMLAHYRRKVPADRKKLADAKRRKLGEAAVARLESRLADSVAGLARYEEVCKNYTDARRRERGA